MDDLQRHIARREKAAPGFARLVQDAEDRRAFMRKMAALRKTQGKSQTQVAAAMRTSASIVSRLESGADVQLSTLEKYLAALGRRLELKSVSLPTQKRRAVGRRS